MLKLYNDCASYSRDGISSKISPYLSLLDERSNDHTRRIEGPAALSRHVRPIVCPCCASPNFQRRRLCLSPRHRQWPRCAVRVCAALCTAVHS
eukprot:5655547-Prymnesium_polylepis.1